MTSDWNKKKLGDVCTFENGDRGTNYPSRSAQTASGVPFINAGHLTESGLDFESMNFISRERFNLLGSGKIRRGDILFCLRGSLGKFASVGNLSEGAIASSLIIVRPKDKIIPDFISAYFQSDICARMVELYRNGAAQPNLSGQSLSQFEIPLPPLPEQQRIVGILDEAFAHIATAKANAEKNRQNARALFESHLQSVFSQRGDGWFRTTVGEQLLLQRGFDITKDAQNPGKVPVVSSGGIKSYHDEPMSKAPGVVLGRKGTLGSVYFLETDYWPHDTTLWVKDFRGNEPKFIYYFFKGLDVKHLDTGTANPALNRNLVHPIEVSWIAPGLQGPVVETFDTLSDETQRLEAIYTQKLTALDELKAALLHQAFSGAL